MEIPSDMTTMQLEQIARRMRAAWILKQEFGVGTHIANPAHDKAHRPLSDYNHLERHWPFCDG